MIGESCPTVRTTDQSKARWLGGGTGFFSTHKLTACTARIACPDNLAALKPPLMWKNTRHSPSWQCSCAEEPGNKAKKGLHHLCMKNLMYKIFWMCYYTLAMIKSVMHTLSLNASIHNCCLQPSDVYIHPLEISTLVYMLLVCISAISRLHKLTWVSM